MAAKILGVKKCPVDFQDYKNESYELADLVADNTIPELSELDDILLKDLLGDIENSIDIELTGLTLSEIEKLTEEPKVDEGPEIEFSHEILLEHNYIVLYFDNLLDWQVAVDKFGLKSVKDLIVRKGQPVGVGRVLKGAEWLERIE